MNIKQIVDEKGVKLGKVASILGLSRSGLWKKMTGRSPFKEEELHRIADFLNVTVEELINGQE